MNNRRQVYENEGLELKVIADVIELYDMKRDMMLKIKMSSIVEKMSSSGIKETIGLVCYLEHPYTGQEYTLELWNDGGSLLHKEVTLRIMVS